MNDRIVERIKKILALAENNPSQSEMEAAMLKAQQLLMTYGLTMESVKDTPEKRGIIESHFYVTKVLENWMSSLIVTVAKQTRCKTFWRRTRINSTNSFEHTAIFIGKNDDAEIASILYKYAFKTIKELSKDYATKNGQGNVKRLMLSYSIGFVAGISDAYEKQVANMKWELALIPSQEVVDRYNEITFRKTTTKTQRDLNELDYVAFDIGREDGLQFDLHGHRAKLGNDG